MSLTTCFDPACHTGSAIKIGVAAATGLVWKEQICQVYLPDAMSSGW